ncbi:uncharacterized protein LOC121599398 [Anopheles merus]|uniref:uncharacterized protein LOC121599398 n=1 Tax=Anopheles merus TaxID=30066 RepID=UPI001BE44DDC|nr:uncharacterized protein LOC121599398 [Anopheles merus]
MYNARKKIYDIGLLKLATNVNIQTTVVPACLWLDDNISIANVKMIGTNEFFDTKSIVQTTRITLKNAEKCQPYLNYISVLTGFSLTVHQMCVFYEFEEHWRWKSGLVYVDLIYDNHIVPFVIGTASFAPIGGLHRLHGFSKLSKFVDWIAETMREEGAGVSFEPLVCAKRHLKYRRRINSTTLVEPNIAVDTTVFIHGNPNAPHTRNCEGALIRKDAVITLAQCARNLMSYSSRVVLADGSFIAIRDIIIHPDYADDSLYSNIAILKLVSEAPVTPIEIAPYYSKHDKITLYASVINGDQSKNNKFFSVDGHNVRFSYECNPSEEHHSRLLKGLHPEHMCLQNNHTLVPGSCEAHPGSAVYWYRNDTKYLLGLYMHGENCGFGEQALGLYVYAYNAWIHSVIDTPSQHSLGYVFPFLKTSDECSYPDGATGTCVSHINCLNISKRAGKSLPIFYCSSRAIVCCPRHLEAQKEEEHEGIAFALYRTV